ncbi:MAG: AAA family ATPase, partial [Thiogranum sp.]
PLSRRALNEYVQHRLRVAGYQGPALFRSRAIRQLHRCSRGIPRLVNLLCHKSLMAAYGSGSLAIRRVDIRRAARDTEDVLQRRPRWLTIVTGLAGLIALTSAGLLYAYGL